MDPAMQVEVVKQGLSAWMIIFNVIVYIFAAYCIARLAARVGMPMKKSFILALIPIANIYLIFKMSGKPGWWTVLAFVPLANVIVLIMAWVAYLQRIGKPGWWVILLLIPFVNIVLFLMLAFGKNDGPVIQAM